MKEIKTVATQHGEQKTCFVVYISTNTGERGKISAKRGTSRVKNSQTVISAQR